MKMNKFVLAGLAFLVGAGTVISFLALLSFSGPAGPCPAPASVTTIADTTANRLLKEYLKTALTPASPVNGIFVDRQQLDALNRLAKENPTIPGFRIYFGKERTGVRVGIVVGVDAKNLDLVSKNIYKTESPGTGPCPPVCDDASPIIKD